MCDMPKYDLTVEQIMSIIDYLDLLKLIVSGGGDVSVEHIDSLIVALKKIKL